MQSYLWPALVTVLTCLLLMGVGIQVGLARARYKIAAPATTGNPDFERVFRVQANTGEAALVFLPALWLFAAYCSAVWAGVIGLVWIAARVWYAVAYARAAEARGPGFGISFAAGSVLVGGSLICIVERLVRGA
jgi:glutathione S-transferase